MNENRNLVFWLLSLIVGALGAAAAYFVYRGDSITAFAFAVVIGTGMFGYWIKASRLVSLSIGLICAVVFGPPFASSCEVTFADWFGTSGVINTVLCLLIIDGWIFFGVAKVVHWYGIGRLFQRPSPDTFNRLAGFGIGAGEGAILSICVIVAILSIEPAAQRYLFAASDTKGKNLVVQKMSQQIVDYAGQTRDSALGGPLLDYGLFEALALLKDLSYEMMGPDPYKIDRPASSELAIDDHRATR